MMNKRKKGFTLVELLIVVCLIGILASLILPRYFGQLEKSRASEALNIMGAIAKGEEAYFTQNGTYLAAAASSSDDDSWLALGIENPFNRAGSYYTYEVYTNTTGPAQYCISAQRCQTPAGGGGTCSGTSDTNFALTRICLGSDGEYSGNNPAGPNQVVGGIYVCTNFATQTSAQC